MYCSLGLLWITFLTFPNTSNDSKFLSFVSQNGNFNWKQKYPQICLEWLDLIVKLTWSTIIWERRLNKGMYAFREPVSRHVGDCLYDCLYYYVHWCAETWHTVGRAILWADPRLYNSGGGTLSTGKRGLIHCSQLLTMETIWLSAALTFPQCWTIMWNC